MKMLLIGIQELALDAVYDVGAVHRGLEILGITGYVSCIPFNGDVLKRDLKYDAESDCFVCKANKTKVNAELLSALSLNEQESLQNLS